MASAAEPVRLTAEQVLAMADGREDVEDQELLDGELVPVTAKGPLHELIATRLAETFARALPEGYHARKEACVAGDPVSLPEPDGMIVRGRLQAYRDHLPTGRDVVVAIEVSVTTLDKDRKKLPLYARAGVPTVWILDVVGRRLEVHTDNRGDRFATVVEYGADEAVEVPVLGERWTVASLID